MHWAAAQRETHPKEDGHEEVLSVGVKKGLSLQLVPGPESGEKERETGERGGTGTEIIPLWKALPLALFATP